jgi:hypothetical protein
MRRPFPLDRVHAYRCAVIACLALISLICLCTMQAAGTDSLDDDTAASFLSTRLSTMVTDVINTYLIGPNEMQMIAASAMNIAYKYSLASGTGGMMMAK